MPAGLAGGAARIQDLVGGPLSARDAGTEPFGQQPRKRVVMPRPRSAPTLVLPTQPRFTQLRKQAEDLLEAFRAGQAGLRAEVEQFARGAHPATFTLTDAQRVLARAYGFSSWPALENHVEGANLAALLATAEAGDPAAVPLLAAARPDLINPN